MAELLEPGFYYHVYNRSNNKESLFPEDRNYSYFLNLVKKHLIPVSEIYCYCLLKNHFHFLLRIKDFDGLPETMLVERNRLHQPFSNLFNAYTKAFNKLFFRSGSLFQKNFHKIRVTNEKYLRNLILYIHLNPVRHGYTDEYYAYKHSSFQQLVSPQPSYLMKDDVIRLFDDLDNFIYCHDQKKFKFDGIIGEIDKMDF
jgi:REP element-mobilizing transposase RayT